MQWSQGGRVAGKTLHVHLHLNCRYALIFLYKYALNIAGRKVILNNYSFFI